MYFAHADIRRVRLAMPSEIVTGMIVGAEASGGLVAVIFLLSDGGVSSSEVVGVYVFLTLLILLQGILIGGCIGGVVSEYNDHYPHKGP